MGLPRLSSTAPSPQAAIKFERLDQSSKSFFLSIFRPLEPAMWCVRRTDQEPPPVTRRTPQLEVSTGWSCSGWLRQYISPEFTLVASLSEYRAILRSCLGSQRKPWLGLGAVQEPPSYIFPQRRSMLEPVPRAPANKPDVFHPRMLVNQKIST